MEREIKKLLVYVFESERKPSDYQAALDMLAAYIEAQLDGRDAAALFPEMKAALESYPPLQEIYEDCYALLASDRQGLLRSPTRPPEFDFSYLNLVKPSKKEIWPVMQKAGRQVRQLFCQLHLVLGQGRAFFEQLPSPLVTEWEMAAMASRMEEEEQRVPVLMLPSREHDLLLRLTITPPQADTRVIKLVVEVIRLSSEQPVSRCRVVLRDDNYRMLESNFTDNDGRVSFANVAPATYVVDVKSQGRVLQIPIMVAWEGM